MAAPAVRTREHVARNAFEHGDVEQSRLLHDQTAVREGGHCAAPSKAACGALRSAVVGAIVASCIAAAVPALSLYHGVAHLRIAAVGGALGLAVGFAIGLYEFVSRSQYLSFRGREKARELWEMDNFPEGEKREMVEIWCSKGLRERDARALINIMCRYQDFFVDIMMTEELGFGPESADDTPAKSALWAGSACVGFSCAPWALQALLAPASSAPATAVVALLVAEAGAVAYMHSCVFNMPAWRAAVHAGVVSTCAAAAGYAGAYVL